jgi:hypothetical protein
MSASSAHGNNYKYYGPAHARLHQTQYYGGWLPQYRRNGEWVQVDLGRNVEIAALGTQGTKHGHYMRSYRLTYSQDGTTWKEVDGRSSFPGNVNHNQVQRTTFQNPVTARFFRVTATSFHSWPGLRMELYGTKNERFEGGQPLGLQTRLGNHMFKASSAHGNNWHYYGPQHARLYYTSYYGGWLPQYNRAGEWIQVDLGKVQEVGKVATQGRHGCSYWVRTYTISYSLNGNAWSTYRENGKVRTFAGQDQAGQCELVVTNTFHQVFKARFVRLTVQAFNGWPSLRWELYAPEPVRYRMGLPFGISTGQIGDHQLRASSAHGNNWNYYGPRNGRLYGGGPYGCWLPQYNRVGEWIQADLGVPQPVGGVATQGLRHHTNAHMITTYNVVYSSDGNSWTPIMAGGARQNFRGNNDGDTVVSHIFDPPIIARFVRIVSTGKNGNNWPCARMELYKPHASRFNTGRLDSLGAGQGMEDGTIPDSKIRASSTFKDSNGDGYAAKYARLNSVAGKGAWAAATNNDKQWLQIETSGDFKVGGVAVQGRAKASGYRQWVTTYRVSVSQDGKKWTAVKNKAGHEAYFRGSSNSDGVVRSAFASPLEARFVRIEPMGWYTHISMRAEVYDTAARQAKLKAQREAAKKAAAQKAAKEKAALEARLAKEKAERAARLAAERAAKEKAERAALAAEHRAKLEKTKAAKDAATKAAADAAAKAKAFEAKIKALRDHKPKEVVEAEKRLVQLNAELTKIRTEADNINFDEEQYARTQRQIADVEEQIAAARTKRIRERLEIAERNAELSFKVQRLDKLRDGIEKLGGDVESILKKAKVDIGALMELVKANKAANSSSGSSGSSSSGSSSSGSSSAAAAVLA